MTIDHTLTWETARVGGMLSYVLVALSVIAGLVASLKLRSTAWPRFVTTELHRFISLLAVVFALLHGVAVWLDPYTGFTAAEVLVPGAAHYRPLWVGIGIVGGYFLLAVWASEYVRRWIGYRWWRLIHFIAFGAFVLATIHGIGTGSDTAEPWALAIYGESVGAVLALVAWRLLSSPKSPVRAAILVIAAGSALAFAVFTLVGPVRPGWNAIANNGNGQGASEAWLAAHAENGSPTAFREQLNGQLTGGNLEARFDGGSPGQLELSSDGAGLRLTVVLDDGWSCSGGATVQGGSVTAPCEASDGSVTAVSVTGLRRSTGGLVGTIELNPADATS
ncbi:MAG: ferric reductase-like transmembrane domain-containing protein [Candidatus Limnocylindria bacterium]